MNGYYRHCSGVMMGKIRSGYETTDMTRGTSFSVSFGLFLPPSSHTFTSSSRHSFWHPYRVVLYTNFTLCWIHSVKFHHHGGATLFFIIIITCCVSAILPTAFHNNDTGLCLFFIPCDNTFITSTPHVYRHCGRNGSRGSVGRTP